MKRLISFSSMMLAAFFLTGCAVVADPYPVQTTAVIRTSPSIIINDGWYDGVYYERGRAIRRLPPPNYYRAPPNYYRPPPPPPPRFHYIPPPRPQGNRPMPNNPGFRPQGPGPGFR